MKHVFSILDYPTKGRLYGKYKGNFPSEAAPKAFSKLSAKFNMLNRYDNKKFLKFTIVNRSTNKKKTFIGTKIKLHTPVIIRGHKYYYKNLITPYPENLKIKVL